MALWHHIPVVREVGHAAVYYPIRVAFGMFACLPARLLGPGCLAVANLTRWVFFRYTRVARENVERMLPEKTAEEQRAVVRGVFLHFALTMRDMILLWRSRKKADVLAEFVDPADLGPVEDLHREGRGLIQVCGHFGNWEIAGFAIGAIFTVNGLSREFRNPGIRRAILRIRTAFGQKILFPSHGIEPMLACLARNECLALLPDKHLRTSRIVVEFFGQRVYAPSGPAILSWRSGSPILVGGAFRVGESSRFRIEGSALIRPDRTQPKGREIQRITQEYMSGLEALIRRYPEQWIWFHSRWKKKIPARRTAPAVAASGSPPLAARLAGPTPPAIGLRGPATTDVASSEAGQPNPVGPLAKRPPKA